MSELSPIPLDKVKKQFLAYTDFPRSPLRSPAFKKHESSKASPQLKYSPARSNIGSGSNALHTLSGNATLSRDSDNQIRKSPFYKLSANDSKASLNMDNEKQVLEMAGYSQKLSTSVLDELTKKAEKFSNDIANGAGLDDIENRSNEKQLQNMSPVQRRFNAIHQKQFNKMESITNHYSAIRRRKQIQEGSTSDSVFRSKEKRKMSPEPMPRKEIEKEKPEELAEQKNIVIPVDTALVASPAGVTEKAHEDGGVRTPVKQVKRSSNIDLGSALKRRRTLIGPREVPESFKSPKHQTEINIDLKSNNNENKIISDSDCYENSDRKARLNSSHITISYAVFCLKKKKTT